MISPEGALGAPKSVSAMKSATTKAVVVNNPKVFCTRVSALCIVGGGPSGVNPVPRERRVPGGVPLWCKRRKEERQGREGGVGSEEGGRGRGAERELEVRPRSTSCPRGVWTRVAWKIGQSEWMSLSPTRAACSMTSRPNSLSPQRSGIWPLILPYHRLSWRSRLYGFLRDPGNPRLFSKAIVGSWPAQQENSESG